jgi:hypothetical protein
LYTHGLPKVISGPNWFGLPPDGYELVGMNKLPERTKVCGPTTFAEKSVKLR